MKGSDDTYINTAQAGRLQKPMVAGEDPALLPLCT